MAMNMTRGFGRECILSTLDIDGYYRFGDVFQIIALDDSHPKPPTRGLGHFPLVMEYSFELNEGQRSQLLEDMCVEATEQFKNRLIAYFYRWTGDSGFKIFK